jgi:isopentenyldiphosphate isomerase
VHAGARREDARARRVLEERLRAAEQVIACRVSHVYPSNWSGVCFSHPACMVLQSRRCRVSHVYPSNWSGVCFSHPACMVLQSRRCRVSHVYPSNWSGVCFSHPACMVLQSRRCTHGRAGGVRR